MDFEKTPQQKELLGKLKELVQQYVTEEEIQKWYQTGVVCPKFSKAYVDAGFGLLGIPEKFGGTPADITTVLMVAEELTRLTAATVPFLENILTMYDMVEYGTDEQIEKTVGAYRDTGAMSIVLSISEPEAGSDNSGMLSYTSVKDGKLVLNGSKTFMTNGGNCPYTLMVAKDDNNAPDNKNMSMWLLPSTAPGLTYEPMEKYGQTVTKFTKGYMKDVELDEKIQLVGERGKGFLLLMKNFEIERCLIGALSLGLAQAALDEAAAYAGKRVAFGKTIGAYQLIQEKLVDMEIKCRNMRNMIYHAAWKHDHGQSIRLDNALVKRYCSRTAVEVCDAAMQILGGVGYTKETKSGRCWQDAKGWQFGGGTEEIMVYIAGRLMIKEYAK